MRDFNFCYIFFQKFKKFLFLLFIYLILYSIFEFLEIIIYQDNCILEDIINENKNIYTLVNLNKA